MDVIKGFKRALRPYRNRALTRDMLRRLRDHQEACGRSAILMATPLHGNLGDQAIVLAQREFLVDNLPEYSVFEIQRYQYELAREEIAGLVRPDDLVVIDGGGNVGTLWPEENDKMNDVVRRFSANPVAIFPQTAYFSRDEEGASCRRAVAAAYASNPHLVFFSRDRPTFDAMRSVAPQTANMLVPDIVLYHDATSGALRRGALLCLRGDKERAIGEGSAARLASELARRGLAVGETSTVLLEPGRIGEGNRAAILSGKWAEFGSAEVVVTDRLHGMIFCAITGTPCVALDNISHKVSMGHEWIAGIPNIKVARDVADVPALLDEVLQAGPRAYDRSALGSYYEAMGRAIRRAIG